MNVNINAAVKVSEIEIKLPGHLMVLPASDPACIASTTAPREDIQRYALEEYKECNNNLRHYGNMRFAEITVFFAVNAGLLSRVYNDQRLASPAFEYLISAVGVFFCILFGVMNRRRVSLWVTHYRRAVQLEEVLGFQQHRLRPKDGPLSNRKAAATVYVITGVFWVSTAILKMVFNV